MFSFIKAADLKTSNGLVFILVILFVYLLFYQTCELLKILFHPSDISGHSVLNEAPEAPTGCGVKCRS